MHLKRTQLSVLSTLENGMSIPMIMVIDLDVTLCSSYSSEDMVPFPLAA